jgi:hypothetical protein
MTTKMKEKNNKVASCSEIEKLLNQQTAVILNVVDKRLENVEKEFKKEINGLKYRI